LGKESIETASNWFLFIFSWLEAERLCKMLKIVARKVEEVGEGEWGGRGRRGEGEGGGRLPALGPWICSLLKVF
jgi:hypothetical protein